MANPSRLETLRTLRVSNLDVAFATSFGTLVGGAFLVGFVKKIGGGDLWIGLLTAIPNLTGMLQIPGAIIGRRYSSYKKYVWPRGLTWRLLYILLAVLPLIWIPNSAKLIAIAILLLVASCSSMLGNATYGEWVASIVPDTSRGAFYSRRNAIATGVGSLVGIVGGVLLDYFHRIQQELLGFAVIFGLGAFAGLVSFYFFWQMADHERPVVVKSSLAEAIKTTSVPFRDHRFRPVLRFLSVTVFGQTFPGFLFAAYAIETLKLPFTVILLCGAMQSLGIIITSPLWGFFADKYGNKPALVIAGILVATNPIAWILARDNQIAFDTTFLLCAHLYFGVSWCGINLCQYNILLSTSPADEKGSFIGAGGAVQALVGGIAPLIGSGVMASLRPIEGAGNSYRIVFGISVLIRGVAVLFLAPVREEGSTNIRTAIAEIRAVTPGGVRALRTLQKSSDATQRERALDQIAEERLALASDAIVTALRDPLPQVRRSASQALSRMRDAEGQENASRVLIDQMREHPELVEEEMVDALGVIGRKNAVEPLARMLKSPRSTVKRAAARALGKLGYVTALEPLIAAASDPDSDLRRTAIQALRQLDAIEAGPVVTQALYDERASVRTAGAEAISSLKFREALPDLRSVLGKELQSFGSDHNPATATGALVYALGTLGDPSDLELLLSCARRAHLMPERRQILLGIARLLGVEGSTYRLLLLDGMARDAMLLETLRPAIRRSKVARSALDAFSSGKESTALELIASIASDPTFKLMAAYPVEEAFLVAAPLASLISRRLTRE